MEPHIHGLAISYFEAIGGAHALSCSILLRYREYDQLALRSTDPKNFNDEHEYYLAVLANDFLRKYADLPTSWDKEANAMDSWWASERSCFKTNYLINRESILHKTSVATAIFDGCRKELSEMLGRVPAVLDFSFGPGATFSMPKKSAKLIQNKLASIPEITDDCWIFLRELRGNMWFRAHSSARSTRKGITWFPRRSRFVSDPYQRSGHFRNFDVNWARGNRLTMVPKDSVKHRTIGIEPSGNVFIQKGLGQAMRKSMNRSGLLLETSQQLHRDLARKGSMDGTLATIDLSSASDSIAYELVKALFPARWFELLDASRSPYTQLPSGNWVKLEKFSSMGNGATFELETALFAALCKSVATSFGVKLETGVNFSVYGDDIIVPTEIADYVIKALSYVGFETNIKKTFLSGPFRESCGGDYFYGLPVRAIRIENSCAGPVDIFALHNKIYRVVQDGRVLEHVIRLLPGKLRRLGGNVEWGDCVLHGRPAFQQRFRAHPDWEAQQTLMLFPALNNFPLERWSYEYAITGFLYGIKSCGQDTPVAGEFRTEWVTTLR